MKNTERRVLIFSETYGHAKIYCELNHFHRDCVINSRQQLMGIEMDTAICILVNPRMRGEKCTEIEAEARLRRFPVVTVIG